MELCHLKRAEFPATFRWKLATMGLDISVTSGIWNHLRTTRSEISTICSGGHRNFCASSLLQMEPKYRHFNSCCDTWLTVNSFAERSLLNYLTGVITRRQDIVITGDMYSFAIVLQEVALRAPPFRLRDFEGKLAKSILETEEIVLEVMSISFPRHFSQLIGSIMLKVKRGAIPPLRPRIPLSALVVPEMMDLVEQCWAENPEMRPTFHKVRQSLTELLGKTGDSIVDYLIRSMEQHASRLEAQVEERTGQFMEQKTRSSNILSQLLPK